MKSGVKVSRSDLLLRQANPEKAKNYYRQEL